MKIKKYKVLFKNDYINFSNEFKSRNLEEEFFIYFPYEGNIESIQIK